MPTAKPTRKTAKKVAPMPFRQSLFWDVDPKTIDPQKHARYIIERVLLRGDVEDFRRVMETYGEEKIKESVLQNKTLDKRSQNFWCLYFNIKPSLCTKNQSTLKQSPFWTR